MTRTSVDLVKLREMVDAGYTITYMTQKLHISRQTVYQLIREHDMRKVMVRVFHPPEPPRPVSPPSPAMLALAEFDPVIARAVRQRLGLSVQLPINRKYTDIR